MSTTKNVLNGYKKTLRILTIISISATLLGSIVIGGIKYDKHKTKTDTNKVEIDTLKVNCKKINKEIYNIKLHQINQDYQNKMILKYLDSISKKLKVQVSPIQPDTTKKAEDIIFRGTR